MYGNQKISFVYCVKIRLSALDTKYTIFEYSAESWTLRTEKCAQNVRLVYSVFLHRLFAKESPKVLQIKNLINKVAKGVSMRMK